MNIQSRTEDTPIHALPVTVTPRRTNAMSILEGCWRTLRGWWRWLEERQHGRITSCKLRLEESVPLGQKRFIAVVKVDDQRFLIGVGSEVSLLAPLQGRASFADVLHHAAGASGGHTEECA